LDFLLLDFCSFWPLGAYMAQGPTLQKLAKALHPWDLLCVTLMPPTVRKVAASKKPMFMLACSLLLRWPDETNAIRFTTGFQVVGDIEHTGLFRP